MDLKDVTDVTKCHKWLYLTHNKHTWVMGTDELVIENNPLYTIQRAVSRDCDKEMYKDRLIDIDTEISISEQVNNSSLECQAFKDYIIEHYKGKGKP